jgi:hypothetical protein
MEVVFCSSKRDYEYGLGAGRKGAYCYTSSS